MSFQLCLGILIVSILTHDTHCTFGSLCNGKPDGSVYPHFGHLSWYIRCVSGIAQMLVCPPDYEAFDHGLTKCIERKPPQTVTVTITTPSTTTTCSPTSVSTKRPTVIGVWPPAVTTIKPNTPTVRCSCHDTSKPTYHRDSRHCDRYFMCYRGQPLPMSCCPGSHWLQAAGRCVPAERSRCAADVLPSTPGAGVWSPACPATGRALYPHPTVCEWFYYCENGVRTRQQCGAFTQWDCGQQRCVATREAQCITGVPTSARLKYYA